MHIPTWKHNLVYLGILCVALSLMSSLFAHGSHGFNLASGVSLDLHVNCSSPTNDPDDCSSYENHDTPLFKQLSLASTFYQVDIFAGFLASIAFAGCLINEESLPVHLAVLTATISNLALLAAGDYFQKSAFMKSGEKGTLGWSFWMPVSGLVPAGIAVVFAFVISIPKVVKAVSKKLTSCNEFLDEEMERSGDIRRTNRFF